MCHCNSGEQTPYHIALQCESVDADLRHQAVDSFRLAGGTEEAKNSIALLNTSRNKNFLDCLVRVMEEQADSLRETIDLN